MKSAIPIAVSTGTFYPLPTLSSIQQLGELGVRDVELTLQQNEFSLTFERQLSMPILPELEALVQNGDLRVRSVHAPMMMAERAYNLWSRLRYLAHSIDVCKRLGGRIVVIHPFHLFRTHEDALSYLSNDGVSLDAALLPGTQDALEQARSENIILALENIQDWLDELFFNTPENMARFLHEMDHPVLKCTFDLMHAQVVGTLDDFIDSVANYIVNIHASDLQLPIKRVPIGKGVIEWDCLMPKLRALPHLHQVTVELANPASDELRDAVKFITTSMSSTIP